MDDTIDESKYRQRIEQPHPNIKAYYADLLIDQNAVDFIASQCQGHFLPSLPLPSLPQCPLSPGEPADKICRCCIGHWSIVIGSNFAGKLIPVLVAITAISPDKHTINGYIYPDLDNIQTVSLAIAHVGCRFPLPSP